jgi:hypothetical protein
VYSGFLQAYQNQQQTPGLEDMREFNQIIKERAPLIKKSILEPKVLEIEEVPKKEIKKDTEE